MPYQKIREFLEYMPKRIKEYDKLLTGQPIWQRRLQDVGYLDAAGCLALGVTGPMLRAAGLPWDLRKTEPYCGYETYDFDVPTSLEGDCWGPLPGADGGDARVAEDHRAGARPAASRAR